MRIEAILEWARQHHYTHLSRLVPYGQTAWTLYLMNATPEQLRRVQEAYRSVGRTRARKRAKRMSETQLSFYDYSLQQCHHKGCTQAVVCSCRYHEGQYVCKEHNSLEWARALAHNKQGGYWHQFGKKWLAELEGKSA